MEFGKMVTIALYTRQKKRHWCIEQSFGLCGRGRGWDDLGEWHWNMYNIIYVTNRQSRFDAWYWVFFGRNDAQAETPVLWPPHAKSWLIGKDSDAGRDLGQEEKGMTEDEMAGWHHRLDGREFEWTQGDGNGQGGLVCCNSWGHKEMDMTEWLKGTEVLVPPQGTYIIIYLLSSAWTKAPPWWGMKWWCWPSRLQLTKG